MKNKLNDKTREELLEIILRKDDVEKQLRSTIEELKKQTSGSSTAYLELLNKYNTTTVHLNNIMRKYNDMEVKIEDYKAGFDQQALMLQYDKRGRTLRRFFVFGLCIAFVISLAINLALLCY